nr:Chain B, Nonapeptide VDSKNTSSW [synthetic construct]
VDSKNTSSW